MLKSKVDELKIRVTDLTRQLSAVSVQLTSLTQQRDALINELTRTHGALSVLEEMASHRIEMEEADATERTDHGGGVG